MARAEVGVVGAGLAGLATAVALAEAGTRVHVLARGHAATHWSAGGIDVGVVPGATSAGDAVERLAARPGHPYGTLAAALPDALAWLRAVLADDGLEFVGELGDAIVSVPTAIGATRRCTILPSGSAAALPPWHGERLVVCGIAGFRDYWPEAVAASLRRPRAWRGQRGPTSVEAVSVELPGLTGRRNLSSLELAHQFDEPAWRDRALDAIARALRAAGRGPGRVALPAVLGITDHAAVLAAARARLPLAPFEVPLVPPSIPGLRLYRALRAALLRSGGRVQVGEQVTGSLDRARGVTRLVAPAAAREFILSVDAVVLATGGIAGGGIVATQDGRLVETVLGLPVGGPPPDAWLQLDPFDPAGHALEAAGVATDQELRPVRRPGDGEPVAEQVRIVGSLLAGQRYLRERCGDGVAIASAWVAAQSLLGSLRPTQRTPAAVDGVAAGASDAR